MTKSIICEECGLTFDNIKIKANHVRWKHRNNDSFKETIRVSTINRYEEKQGKIKTFEVKCYWCQKIFLVKEKEKKFPMKEKYFCPKRCCGQYSRSFLTKEKQLEGMKKYYLLHPPQGNTIYNLKCVICNTDFKNNNKNVKTCGEECYKKLCSKNSKENPNCGGETNYKKYRYKGIWMDSSWEKELAEWMDKNNILWERDRKHILWWTDENGKKRRYYPDFYLPTYNLYVDTKNPYLMEYDKNKISCVLKENNVQIIVDSLKNVKDLLWKLY